jgi:hypothetical protein
MYRRPKFLEVLHQIREEMSRECDYDMDLFVQLLRHEQKPNRNSKHQRTLLTVAKPRTRRRAKARRGA